MKKMIGIALIALLITGCATDKFGQGDAADYKHAQQMLNQGRYQKTALFLQNYATKYPYSKFTIQAELLRIFAAYKSKQFVSSEVLSKEFISRHPTHPNVDYAEYMYGMSLYRESLPAERDQTETRKAIEAFKRLLKQHPSSDYAKDGERHLQLLYNRLAGHELDVGKFYFNKGRYVAAANRFQVILDRYQTTPAIEPGLYYLAASFAKLGVKDSARQTAMLLVHNYPNSDWARKAKPFL